MTFNDAKKRYIEACRLALLTPATIKKADSTQRGDRWILVTIVTGVRGTDRVEVAIVTPDDCLVGNRLKGYFARKQREAINVRVWQEKTLPELKARNGVVDKPKPELHKPAPMNMQPARPPRKPRNPFDRR